MRCYWVFGYGLARYSSTPSMIVAEPWGNKGTYIFININRQMVILFWLVILFKQCEAQLKITICSICKIIIYSKKLGKQLSLNSVFKRLQQQIKIKFTGLKRQLRHLSYNILQLLLRAFWDRWWTTPSLHKGALKGRQGVNEGGDRFWRRAGYLHWESVLPRWRTHTLILKFICIAQETATTVHAGTQGN